jgi:hypothetical protein
LRTAAAVCLRPHPSRALEGDEDLRDAEAIRNCRLADLDRSGGEVIRERPDAGAIFAPEISWF